MSNPTEGRAFFDRTKARGKTSNEAMRLLKRRLSDIVFRTMLADAARQMTTGREGTRVTTLTPARPAHNPTPALRTSHFPDPPPPTLEPCFPPRLDTEGSHVGTFATASRPPMNRQPGPRSPAATRNGPAPFGSRAVSLPECHVDRSGDIADQP